MAKTKKISPLTKALLETAGDMRKAGLMDQAAHGKIAQRHGRSTGQSKDASNEVNLMKSTIKKA